MPQMKNISQVEKQIELICDDLTVFGNVYEGSIIDAHKLIIKGSTYKDTTQFAKYADIQKHEGVLRCHKANIQTLNGGEVHASSLTIDTCNGGNIFAQDVTINTINSNVNIYASNSITVDSIDGEGNELYINYKKVPILMSKLELITDDIEELNFLLQEASQKNSPTQKDIENEISSLKTQYQEISNSPEHAKITIKQLIQGKSTIVFEINDEELIYHTQHLKYSPFSLNINNNTITLLPTNTHTTI